MFPVVVTTVVHVAVEAKRPQHAVTTSVEVQGTNAGASRGELANGRYRR
jgi:hypothetical protein